MGHSALLNKCIRVEKSAASIYKNMAKIFPEEKVLWESLCNDEIEHASFLSDVKTLGLSDEMLKLDLPPSSEMIQKALELSEKISKKIRAGSLTRTSALAILLKLEETMVETYTNKMIARLLSCEDRETHKKLVADEKKHINKIKRMKKSA